VHDIREILFGNDHRRLPLSIDDADGGNGYMCNDTQGENDAGEAVDEPDAVYPP
jgi:hypothetical protein